jgi:hypothetical protein
MGSGGIAPPFLTLALDGDEWSAPRPGRFTPGERSPGNHWIGGCVGSRASVDAVEKRKILQCRESNPGRPARSLSVYRLRYPGSWCSDKAIKFYSNLGKNIRYSYNERYFIVFFSPPNKCENNKSSRPLPLPSKSAQIDY